MMGQRLMMIFPVAARRIGMHHHFGDALDLVKEAVPDFFGYRVCFYQRQLWLYLNI
jgi:hypothetical protein